MKVLLYFENEKALHKSGIGRAMHHQMKSLAAAGVECTTKIRENVDIAHINTYYPASYRLLKRMQRKGIKVIVHGHSTKEDFAYSFRFWRYIHPIMNFMIVRMYRNADCIIAPTPYAKRLIEGYKGVSCPVYAVSNGIELSRYSFDNEAVKIYKDFFGITTEKVIIGIGLLFERKGIFDFFKVAELMPDYTFIWFGHLPRLLTQHKVLKAIKKRPKNVLMPGYIEGDVIKGALLAADAFFFPSIEETEGIVTLEALASRIPIVVRNIGVYDEWLKDKEHVYMGNNPEEFASLLRKVTTEPNLEMIEKGYEVVIERNLPLIGEKLLAIYKKVLEEK